MQGLSLQAALFFLFVLVPGYMGMWAAGRLGEAQHKLHSVLYRGVTSFGVAFLLLLSVFPGEAKVFLNVLSGKDYSGLTSIRLLGWFIAFCLPAVLLGFADFADNLRFAYLVKTSRAWRHFLMKDTAFELSPRDDMFWEIFQCYRAVGKRPLVTAVLDKDSIPVSGDTSTGRLRGEVLKVSWGLRPGILVADMDFPQNVLWVPMQDIKAVVFENPGVQPECGMLDHRTRELLNMIHPGYGDEVEERYRRKMDH